MAQLWQAEAALASQDNALHDHGNLRLAFMGRQPEVGIGN
jgi:hypothetical protein